MHIRSTPVLALFVLSFSLASRAALPPDYKGKPFEDSAHHAGAQAIPGRLECALFDAGGEGVTYHDTDAKNNGSGGLNRQPNHQRPHATPYHWDFRTNDAVDLSYTKDFADFNHTNLVTPPTTSSTSAGRRTANGATTRST